MLLKMWSTSNNPHLVVFYIMAHMLGKILLKWISCNQIYCDLYQDKLFCLEVISHDQLLIKMCLHELRHNTILQLPQASLWRLNYSHWEVQSPKQRIIRYSMLEIRLIKVYSIRTSLLDKKDSCLLEHLGLIWRF